jgi:putative salt-induced outer membrane protein YdiY
MMMIRYVTTIVFTMLLAATFASAQDKPAEPPPLYTGNIGGGFAVTGGNTRTSNFNLTAALTRDPKQKNVIKGTAAYLRGNQNDLLNLDRTAFNLRDEYSLSDRVFLFGQMDYLRDKFKEIIFLWVPSAGVGYKLVKTDATQFSIDGAAGGLLEKNPGRASSKSGSLITGQRFQQKLSATATITESISTIWKTKDFADSLTVFSLGATTTLIGNLELKLEFIDSYKNKPANPTLKKNDTAFVTAFVVKF